MVLTIRQHRIHFITEGDSIRRHIKVVKVDNKDKDSTSIFIKNIT